MGVPEGAMTVLLTTLSTLTILPYVAGRDLGAYDVPELLAPKTHWFLASTMPIVWAMLLVPRDRLLPSLTRKSRLGMGKDLLKIIGFVALFLVAGFLTCPIEATHQGTQFLETGKWGSGPIFTFPVASTTNVTITPTVMTSGAHIEQSMGVWIKVCSTKTNKQEICAEDQRGTGSHWTTKVFPGLVTISLFNFGVDPPKTINLVATYVDRRL
jgi:hypothetical protein